MFSRTLQRAVLKCVALLCLILPSAGFTSEKLPPMKVGAYITSIYDINPVRGTFSADFWVWRISKSSFSDTLAQTLDINYLSSEYPLKTSGYFHENLNPQEKIEQIKVQGVFLHDFDMRAFPFDHQFLKINFEDAERDLGKLVYLADPSTDFDPAISIDGWKIVRVSAESKEKSYNTRFGIPDRPEVVDYSRVVLTVELQRDSMSIFFKLTLGLFSAIVAAMATCAMPTLSDDIFTGRMTLLSGTLLATIVSLQYIDGLQGNTTTITLIDKLHLLGALVIIFLIGVTVRSRALVIGVHGEIKSRQFDHRMFWIAFVFLVVAGAWLVHEAMNIN